MVEDEPGPRPDEPSLAGVRQLAAASFEFEFGESLEPVGKDDYAHPPRGRGMRDDMHTMRG